MKRAAQSRFLVLDAYGVMFRNHFGYQANPKRRATDGKDVSAMYGYCSHFMRVAAKLKPTHAASALDVSGPTFRDNLYAQYKAHRQPCPPELKWQLQQLSELNEALGLSEVKQSGFEADDVVGTLVTKAHAEGMLSDIVTWDKDFSQLVNSDTSLIRITENKISIVDEEAVKRLHKVRPDQFADMLALVGDASDNIPGVKGIGPVYAAKLLGEYRGIEQILAAAKIPGFLIPRLAPDLLSSAADIERNRKLVKICLDVPDLPEMGTLQFAGLDKQRLLKCFRDFRFPQSLADQLEELEEQDLREQERLAAAEARAAKAS